MRGKKTILTLALIIAFLLVCGLLFAYKVKILTSSDNFIATADVVNSSGGQSSSTNFIAISSVGEPIDSSPSQSSNFNQEPGFISNAGAAPPVTLVSIRFWMLY